jgi:hypothetical protein
MTALLHPGEGGLDAGSEAPVLGVVLLLTAKEGPPGASAVRHDEARAQVGAVGCHRRARSLRGQI